MPDPHAAEVHPTPERTSHATEVDNARGASWMLVSVLSATMMNVAVKWGAEELHSSVLVAMRSLGGLMICLMALLFVKKLRGELSFSVPWQHVWRGALIGASTQCGFYAISHLPLALVTVIFFTAPIFTALLSIPIQGERFGVHRGSAVAAGFLGVLIVMRPELGGFDLAILLALASSVMFALVLLSARSVANHDGPFAAYLSSTVMSLIVSLPLAAPNWSWPQSGEIWWAVVLLAIVSLIRNIADIQSYRYAEAAVLAPLSYLRLIFLVAAGYVFFSETPDARTIAGGALIICAALYIARRERLVKGRQKR